MALFRLVDIITGRILIEIAINTDEIHTRLSIVPQDVMLFIGTIRENLNPNNHYTDLDFML